MTAGKFKVVLIAAGIALMVGCKQAQVSPTPSNHIYPAIEAAPADVSAALAEAQRTHKRVILDFGGDWCIDCQVLNIYFHRSPNAQLLAKNFILVDVNVGQMDANLNIAHKYGVPAIAVPALAVVDGNGEVVYAQNKEFDDMSHMQSSAVTEFLNKWKP